MLKFAVGALAAMTLAGSCWAAGAPAEVDAERIANPAAGDWLSHGRTYSEQRFSPLKQITADNVDKLGLAWFQDLGTLRGQEATPLAIDGVLYVSTAWSFVNAYDGQTGRLLWSYDPQVPKEISLKICCDAVNRGVAAWEGKIYVGTLDGRLVALDAATGKPVWSVQTIDPTKRYTISGAPRVIKGKVIIGNSGSEFGVRGYVSAYDAATGKLIWRFYTVPGDPSKPETDPAMTMAAKTWSGRWWDAGGGGTVWNAMSYDPALNLLYFGTANGTEWVRSARSAGTGDNLFLASIVALDADTGKYVWHYQTTPGDEWDYDSTEDLVLADLTIGGAPRQVLMQANKNGFFYVLDRKTGALISGEPFAPMNWAKGIDPKTGRPNIVPEARYSELGTRWVGEPSPLGAHAWQPMAFSPDTGLVYIPTQESSFPYLAEKNTKPDDYKVNHGLDTAAVSMPADPKIRKSALDGLAGYLLAWDPVRQKEVWRAPYIGPWNGGVLTTAGNLVAEGSAAGDFTVYRADSGEKRWSFAAGTAVMAGPISYEAGGEQYIGVLVGWGGSFPLTYGELNKKSGNQRNISRLLVFKPGGTLTLPPPPAEVKHVLDPPPSTADSASIDHGKLLFSRYCGSCHGDAVIGGGVIPDLRYSAFLKDDGWFDIVLSGTLEDQGMASFAAVLKRDDVAAIRAYVIERANEDKAIEAAATK